MIPRHDFDVIASAVAGVHREAAAGGQQEFVLYAEKTAVAIAATLASQYRTFDPARFILAACDAADASQLLPAARQYAAQRFEAHSGAWDDDTPVETAIRAVAPRFAGSKAVNALYRAGIYNLGSLAGKSGAEIEAVPGLGQVGRQVAHDALSLWRQRSGPGTAAPDPGIPSTVASAFPAGNPLQASGRRPSASRRRPPSPGTAAQREGLLP